MNHLWEPFGRALPSTAGGAALICSKALCEQGGQASNHQGSLMG